MREKIETGIKNFLESYYFILILSLIAVVTWRMDLTLFPYLLAVIFGILIFLTKANKVTLFSIVMFVTYSTRCSPINYKSVLFFITCAFGAVLAFLAIKEAIKVRFQFKNRIFYTMLIVLGTMLISMINSPVISDSLIYIGKYLIPIGLFLMALNFIENNEENKEYIIISLIFSSFVIGSEMILNSIRIVGFANFTDFFKNLASKTNHLGWGLTNHYVMIIVTSCILNIYLFMRKKELRQRIVVIILTIIELIFFILTLSRGAYIAFVAVIILLIVCIIFYSNNRKIDLKYGIIFLSICLVAVLLISLTPLSENLKGIIKKLGFSLSGREGIYELAISKFKKHPIIGCGAYSSKYYISTDLANTGVSWVKNYHNIYLQVLACQGILGFVAVAGYVLYYMKLCLKRDLFKNLLLILMVYLLVHGLVDTTLFNLKIMPILSFLMIFLFDKKAPEEDIIDKNDKNDIIQI